MSIIVKCVFTYFIHQSKHPMFSLRVITQSMHLRGWWSRITVENHGFITRIIHFSCPLSIVPPCLHLIQQPLYHVQKKNPLPQQLIQSQHYHLHFLCFIHQQARIHQSHVPYYSNQYSTSHSTPQRQEHLNQSYECHYAWRRHFQCKFEQTQMEWKLGQGLQHLYLSHELQLHILYFQLYVIPHVIQLKKIPQAYRNISLVMASTSITIVVRQFIDFLG